jgi:predicted permease
MIRPGVFFRRLQDLIRARQLDRDLQQQIASHLDEATDEYVRLGLSLEDARRTALRRFGDARRVQEAWRDARSFLSVDSLLRDVRHALRALHRNSGFSVVVALILTIGTAALTTVFVLLNRVVLQPLPFPESERLVTVRHSAPGLGLADAGLSHGLFWHYSDHARSLESLATYEDPVPMNLRLPDQSTRRVLATYASAALFEVFGVRPVLGRLFTEEDGRPGFMNMKWRIPVLISHRFWTSYLGADPHVVSRTLTINDNPREVVGVLPDGFRFPDPDTELWVLLEPSKGSSNLTRRLSFDAVGRLRPGTTAAAAEIELTQLVRQLEGSHQDAAQAQLTPVVTPLKSVVIRDVAHVIWLVFGGMILLLLVTCATAGVLFLVRADDRAHEMAVRRSLGAYGPHLARLFFIEALVLTGAAAGIGLLSANGILAVLLASTPFELPRSQEIELDGATILFSATVAVLIAAFYGGFSVLRQGSSLTPHLQGSGAWATSRRRVGARGHDALLILQVALALTLMIGAVLMGRTYRNLTHRELGFSAGGVLSVEIALPSRKANRHVRIYQEVVDRVRQLPQVDDAAAASFLPLTVTGDLFPVIAGERPIPFKFIVPGYFQTMRTPVIEGAGFSPGEHATVPHPVVVSVALARRLYPGQSAIGKSIRRLDEDGSVVTLGRMPTHAFTIAGVVGDVHETTLRGGPEDIVYIPLIDPPVEQSIVPTTMHLVVRSQRPPLSLAADVRQAVASADPDLSIGEIQTMESVVADARGTEAFVGTLLLIAATVSLSLGAIGIYGSVAHIVRLRRREIGIRLALGASRMKVIRLVTSASIRGVLVGSLLGLVISLLTGRLLDSLLFGVDPHDPTVLVGVTAAVITSGAAAAFLAARQGTGVAPLVALRNE